MDYYLIVSERGREYVLRKGSRKVLEALAKKYRAAKLFRYVRVDAIAPPGHRRHSGPGAGDEVTGGGDADAAPP
jgi:hypothetical protein